MIDQTQILHCLTYVFTGTVTGLAAGLFGIGGGLLVVPALLYLFEHMHTIPAPMMMQFAAGTSLAIMIFTAASAVYAHMKKGNILWHTFQRLWPGIVIGTLVGAYCSHLLPTLFLKKILGIMLLVALVNMIYHLKATPLARTINRFVDYGVGLSIGLLSGLIGIGGGVLIIPYLSYCGIDLRKISAVSIACTLLVALIGTGSFMLTGFGESGLPAYTTGYIYWPAVLWITIPSILMAPIGARLTYTLPLQQLKYAFSLLLLLIAIKLLI